MAPRALIYNPAQIDQLLRAANMRREEFNTGVVLPEGRPAFRVQITNGYTPYGDHVAVLTCPEPGFPGATWALSHYTPARARVLAALLLEAAERVENN